MREAGSPCFSAHSWRGWLLPVLVLAGLLVGCRAQHLSAPTRQALARWEAKPRRYRHQVPCSGWACPSDSAGARTLCQVATDAELRWIAGHMRPAALRSYAFNQLVLRRSPEAFLLLLDHLTDRRPVWVSCWHYRYEQATGDWWLGLLTPSDEHPERYRLTPAQQVVVDSLLLFRPGVRLDAQEQLLTRLPARPRYYRRVRQLARQAHWHPAALRALARYQRAADVGLIRRSFGQRATQATGRGQGALYAVQAFPHEQFYPDLRRLFARNLAWRYFDEDTWVLLYQALARYPRPETVALFQQTFTAEEGRRRRLEVCLQAALLKYPHPQWAPLQAQLQLSASQQEELKQYLARPD